jgi:hypothetical protein
MKACRVSSVGKQTKKPAREYMRQKMEATTGIEPVMAVLQTAALATWLRRLNIVPWTTERQVQRHPTISWSGRRDSNPRHSAWEADALPLNYSRVGGRYWIRTSDLFGVNEALSL